MSNNREEEDDSGKIISKSQHILIDWKFRDLYRFREEANKRFESNEERLRQLEDWKLEQRTRMRDFIKWVGILAASITGAVSLLVHILFGK